MAATVDADRFARVLRKVEGAADGGGRDQPPELFAVYDTAHERTAATFNTYAGVAPDMSLGPPLRYGGYAAQALLGRCLDVEGVTYTDAVTNFALNLAYADIPEAAGLRSILFQPGVLGFAFRYEAWGTQGRENTTRVVLGEFDHVADLPDAAEARVVQGRDIGGGQYRVTRARGLPAVVEVGGMWRGDFVTVTALLCDIAAGTVPPAAEFRRRYPTLKTALFGS